MQESFLDEGFILDKKIGVGQPKRIENANILVANTAMDTDKIKIYGARVKVDSMQKVADIEKAEREKMRSKVCLVLLFSTQEALSFDTLQMTSRVHFLAHTCSFSNRMATSLTSPRSCLRFGSIVVLLFYCRVHRPGRAQ